MFGDASKVKTAEDVKDKTINSSIVGLSLLALAQFLYWLNWHNKFIPVLRSKGY